MRPADEVEVAAHSVLMGEPVLPGAIVYGPEQTYADERGIDPITSRHTEAYNGYRTTNASPSTTMAPTPAPGTPIPSRRAFARDKTGDPARSKSLQHGLVGIDSSICEHYVPTDPIEEMVGEPLSEQAFA